MNRRKEIAIYVLTDIVCSMVVWTLFWLFRKVFIESQKFGINVALTFDYKFYLALMVIPLFWVFLFRLAGLYSNVFRKSRIAEIKQIFISVCIGVIILFFTLLLNDYIVSYKSYYLSISVLFSLQFTFISIGHIILTGHTNSKIHSRKIGFKTLLIGSNSKAYQLYNELENQKKSSGNKFVGFVHIDRGNGFSSELQQHLKHLGEFENIETIIENYKIEEVIIAIESSEHKYLEKIIYTLDNSDVLIKIIPDMYDILTGSVRMSSLLDTPLIIITRDLLDAKQQFFKRLFDICVSLFFLILSFPFCLMIALLIKITSKGNVMFHQERIGYHGKSFTIYKFRTMNMDAEKNGPALSSKYDTRITPFGRFLRRSRLDELPQFYNVLRGDMAVVGPRPERKFFMEQLLQITPHYKHLLKVKPGITSWGQIKYGYAENVNQMVERMKYDLLYVENISLLLDMRILIYTVLIMLQGRGK